MFIGPFEHHSNELPVARVDRRRRRRSREDADGHIDLDRLRERARASTPTGRCKIGSFSAASQRHRHRHRHRRRSPTLLHEHGALSFWDFAAAAPYVDIEMYARPRRATRSAYKDAIFLSPAQVHRRPGHARACSSRAASCSPTGCRTCPAAARSPTSTRRAPLPRRPGAPRGGRHARRSSSRSAPGWCSSSRRPSASRRSARTRSDFLAPRGRGAGATSPAIEILGNLDAERLSIVSFVVRAPGGPLPAPQLRRRRCSTTCSASSRAAAARAPGPTATGCSASTSSARTSSSARSPRGCEGIKPGWVRVNFNYFISDAVARLHRRGRAPRRARRLAAARRLPLRPAHRPAGATATGSVEPPLRLRDVGVRRRRAMLATRAHDDRGGEDAARRAPARGARDPRRGRRRRTCPRTRADVSADFEHLRWFDLPAGALDA